MTFNVRTFLLSTALSVGATALLAAGTHPVTGEKLSDNQTYTWRLLDEITSLDPQLNEDVDGSQFGRDMFEGLYNQDAAGNLIPGVALSHTVSDDKMVYTFTLRDNAKWSDGKPVTANDFVYAWRRLADPATASEYQWFVEIMGLKNAGPVMSGDMPTTELGVKAIDDHTLEVTLDKPLPYFALTTTHTSTYPAPQWAVEAHGADWIKPENIVVNGAYKLTERTPQERLVLERNANYWDNDNTIINKIEALVINDENVAFTRYDAGELDKTDVPAGQFAKLAAERPSEAVNVPELCSYYYTVNMTEKGHPALQDKRVRQALSYAIDRDIITKNILQAGQFSVYTFTPAATANFTVPTVAYATLTQAERDAKAKELMADAGVENLEVELIYNTSESHKKIAIAVSQMWKQKLGVEVTLANQEWKTFLDTRGNQNYQVARAGWCGDYNEASTFLDLVASSSGYNDAKYSNAEVDQLLAEAKTSANPQANYTRVEEIIADEFPIIPIYHYTANFLLKDDIKGWPFQNVEKQVYTRTLYRVED